ncbi:MAG TPA: protein kinase [Polyangiaceae bacterium LLY-WYZ-14_1]|nr:protein kinase [Polyangiaceae bacterium LLY-WYZ-14_1]
MTDSRKKTFEVPSRGSLVDGVYRVERLLGRGGMGVVLLARDERLQRLVALKLIRPSSATSQDARLRFLKEARAMANVRHENVVQVFSLGEVDSFPYFAMEYVPGLTLDQWRRRRPPDEPGTVDEVIGLVEQVCRGVSAVNAAGIVHGDVKPANVLIGPAFRVAVTDFGLVRILDRPALEGVGGTPPYMAPESIKANETGGDIDVRADVYGLGVLTYELLTGQLPHPIDTMDDLKSVVTRGAMPLPPSELRADLPPAFDDVLLRALVHDPEERIQHADLFRKALMGARQTLARPLTSVRVLLADDDPEFRALAEGILDQAFPGATIETADDGERALSLAERAPYSLAVIDLDMPRMNGVELTAALRGSESEDGDDARKRLPILVVTARGGAPDWALLQGLGADGFLVKPVDPYSLVSTARRLVAAASGRDPVTDPPPA